MAALKAAGCKRIYREKASGDGAIGRDCIVSFDQLRKGDRVVVYKLDRQSRSFRDVLIPWSG